MEEDSIAYEELNGNPARGRVLIVGRLWGRGLLKGQHELITIWPEVLGRFPNAELLIVGDGEGRGELEKLIKELKVEESVRLLGTVNDNELARLYKSSDLYAMPSRGEGFGLVYAEAMRYGLPCIASKFDAGSEVVIDGETGLLVDPDNPEELLTAICKILGDNMLREKMGHAAQQRAATLFSLDGFNNRIKNILRESQQQN